MNKYKLSFVKNEEKMSAKGKKYIALSVKIDGDPEDRWYNGLGNEYTKTWQVGDLVPLELYEEEYNGKMYWKVRPVSKTDMLSSEVDDLKRRVGALEGRGSFTPPSTSPAPANTSNTTLSADNLPF